MLTLPRPIPVFTAVRVNDTRQLPFGLFVNPKIPGFDQGGSFFSFGIYKHKISVSAITKNGAYVIWVKEPLCPTPSQTFLYRIRFLSNR